MTLLDPGTEVLAWPHFASNQAASNTPTLQAGSLSQPTYSEQQSRAACAESMLPHSGRIGQRECALHSAQADLRDAPMMMQAGTLGPTILLRCCARLEHVGAVEGVGPVGDARQAVAADGHTAGAAVAREHQDVGGVGHPGHEALEVARPQPCGRPRRHAYMRLRTVDQMLHVTPAAHV